MKDTHSSSVCVSTSFITHKLQLDLREAEEGPVMERRLMHVCCTGVSARKAGSRFWTKDRFMGMSQLFTVFWYHTDELDVRD